MSNARSNKLNHPSKSRSRPYQKSELRLTSRHSRMLVSITFGPMLVKYRRGTVKEIWMHFYMHGDTRCTHRDCPFARLKLIPDGFAPIYGEKRKTAKNLQLTTVQILLRQTMNLQRKYRQSTPRSFEDELVLEAIEWRFNPPHAPHMGGSVGAPGAFGKKAAETFGRRASS